MYCRTDTRSDNIPNGVPDGNPHVVSHAGTYENPNDVPHRHTNKDTDEKPHVRSKRRADGVAIESADFCTVECAYADSNRSAVASAVDCSNQAAIVHTNASTYCNADESADVRAHSWSHFQCSVRCGADEYMRYDTGHLLR